MAAAADQRPAGTGPESRSERWLSRVEAVVPKPAAWAFALRIWLAMVLALYAAFWLQLESASSAAVCVAILAQPKRGQALSKALYRFLGTLVGGLVAMLLASAFAQDRVLMLVSFTVWLSACTFTAQFLQDTRAYGAVLSGYTVAIVGISNLDTPELVFGSAVSRTAAIALGIIAITFINDALASPSTWRSLRPTLAAALAATKAFAHEAVTRGDPGPEAALAAIARIAPMRGDASAIAGELDDGPQRAAGARSAIAALYALVAAARTFARARARLARPDPAVEEAAGLCAGLTGGGPESPGAAALDGAHARIRALLVEAVRRAEPDVEAIVALQRALDLAMAAAFAQDGLGALSDGHRPMRDVDLPTHRPFELAARAALRIAVAFGLTAAFFVATGWPATTFALVQVAATCALASTTPSPEKFAQGVLIGMPLAALCAGIVLFLVLPAGQGFPILALGLVPTVFLGCFISLNPPTFSIGFILLVFSTVLIGPANPQTYDFQSFATQAFLVVTAALILSITVRLVLPVSPHRARRYAHASAQRDVRDALVGAGGDATTRTSLNSDRLFQYGQLNTGPAIVRARRLRLAFALAHLEASAARAHAQLRDLQGLPGLEAAASRARNALAVGPPAAIETAARELVTNVRNDEPETILRVARAVGDLCAVHRVMMDHGRFLRRLHFPGL